MFCRNCGKELVGKPEICLGCGAKPFAGTSFCHGCGAVTSPATEVCVKCGVRFARSGVAGKSKVASVLIAVFLGYWTWLYTYKRDGWKFWLSLSLTLASLGNLIASAINLASEAPNLPEEELGAAVAWLIVSVAVESFIGFGMWVWSIVDSAVKSNEWYQDY